MKVAKNLQFQGSHSQCQLREFCFSVSDPSLPEPLAAAAAPQEFWPVTWKKPHWIYHHRPVSLSMSMRHISLSLSYTLVTSFMIPSFCQQTHPSFALAESNRTWSWSTKRTNPVVMLTFQLLPRDSLELLVCTNPTVLCKTHHMNMTMLTDMDTATASKRKNVNSWKRKKISTPGHDPKGD